MARRQSNDFEFHRVYEPDMARMVKALRVLLEYTPAKGKGREAQDHTSEKENKD